MTREAVRRWLVLLSAWLVITFPISGASAQENSRHPQRECSSITYIAPSGAQNNIIFALDKPYVCGQFANGDWWIATQAQATAIITAISPAATPARNGYEVNPSSKTRQGFDSRMAGHDASLIKKLPLVVRPGSSVVKTVSLSPEQDTCRPCLQFAAVLTVVLSPIPESHTRFRPGYYGQKKTLYSIPQSVAGKFPRHSARCCTKAKDYTFTSIARRYQGVQLDHIERWFGDRLHPKDNMPNYGAAIATDNAAALLRMMLDDFDIHNSSHRSALVNYLQMSVDLRSMASNGVTWPGSGGHGNGRKLPLVVAEWLIGTGDFDAAVRNSVFSEDGQVYISSVSGRALFGSVCSDTDYWKTTMFRYGARDCRDPYGYVDGGGYEIGGAYQFCCTAKPWKYTVLALRMLGLQSSWNHDALFQYVDRWVEDGVWSIPDPCAPYDGDPKGYGKDYGPAGSGCIPGSGRWPKTHNTNADGGHYGNAFAEQLWTSYRQATQ